MIELPPDVEDRLREKAALRGQAVGDRLRWWGNRAKAEEALKAFLVFHGVRVAEAHDLGGLVTRAGAFTLDHAPLGASAAHLAQYARLFRYSGAQLEPAAAEHAQADEEASRFGGGAR